MVGRVANSASTYCCYKNMTNISVVCIIFAGFTLIGSMLGLDPIANPISTFLVGVLHCTLFTTAKEYIQRAHTAAIKT